VDGATQLQQHRGEVEPVRSAGHRVVILHGRAGHPDRADPAAPALGMRLLPLPAGYRGAASRGASRARSRSTWSRAVSCHAAKNAAASPSPAAAASCR
jgi:hypothetical protein